MALHGLDRAAAPEAAKARAMLDEIHGTWWNVYIGGPRSKGSGWTPDRVRQYEAQGITRFLLIYVGRQGGDVPLLTTSQGRQDGDEACQIAARFGYDAAGTPICLDLEGATFDKSEQGSLNYARGWCHAVRAQRLRPGVYSNPRALIPLARDDGPDWVWVAAWVSNKVDPNADPHRIPHHLADDLWANAGQRAWQYAGRIRDEPATVGGLEVDINVADDGCLVGTGHPTEGTTGPGSDTSTGGWDEMATKEEIKDAVREVLREELKVVIQGDPNTDDGGAHPHNLRNINRTATAIKQKVDAD